MKTCALTLLLLIPVLMPAASAGKSREIPPAEAGRPEASTRREHWLSIRREKSANLIPYRQGALERGLLWVENEGLKLIHYRFKGFQPTFGGLPTGSGFALGTHYRMPDAEENLPDLESSASWSVRGYQAYDLQFGRLQRDRRGAALYLDLGYGNFPQEDFFGLGPDSRRQDRTDFRLERESYDVVGAYRFNSWLHTSIRAGYLQVDTGPGTDDRFPDIGQRFSASPVPGLRVQPDFLRLHYGIAADYRDVPGNPHGGGLLAAGFSRYDQRGGSRFSFNRLELDARHYFPIGSTVRILALRFFASFDEADSDGAVPFYLQQTLGGGDTLRGFREFRFRDSNLFYMSGEYRWEPVRAVELALFYDAGKVFSRRRDFDFDGLRKSIGFGVRFKAPGSVVFRIDTARSDEGLRVYFKFGPSF